MRHLCRSGDGCTYGRVCIAWCCVFPGMSGRWAASMAVAIPAKKRPDMPGPHTPGVFTWLSKNESSKKNKGAFFRGLFQGPFFRGLFSGAFFQGPFFQGPFFQGPFFDICVRPFMNVRTMAKKKAVEAISSHSGGILSD